MKSIPIICILLLILFRVASQDLPISIHAEQQQFYSQFGEKGAGFYDSISGFSGLMASRQNSDCQLQKIVFGFHPYWAGSDYFNYQWNLISDQNISPPLADDRKYFRVII